MKLYYVVQNEMLSGGVIEAQVVAALRAQSEEPGQPATKLIFLEPARVALGARARKTLKRYRAMWPGGTIAVVPFVGRMGESAPGKALAAYLALERFSSEDVVFHCRGAAATLSAGYARDALGKGRIVYDVRGAGPYEATHRLGFSDPVGLSALAQGAYDTALEQERRAARVADAVFAVSPGLCGYATSMLGVQSDRVRIVPSCVSALTFDEANRRRTRESWGVSDRDLVFVYSGRLGSERLPDQMFRIFAAVRRIRPGARLVLFTYLNQVSDLGTVLARHGVPEREVLVRSLPRDEVVSQLCGADVGFMLLERAFRYQYCFPIKVPEYLAAGLALIVSPTMEQIPELVTARGLGWVVDSDAEESQFAAGVADLVEQAERDREALRQSALQTCSELFVWKQHVGSIREAYGLGDRAGAECRSPVGGVA